VFFRVIKPLLVVLVVVLQLCVLLCHKAIASKSDGGTATTIVCY
jgi:hypothetical protein